MQISLSDPIFDKEPRLRSLRTRFWVFFALLFVEPVAVIAAGVVAGEAIPVRPPMLVGALVWLGVLGALILVGVSLGSGVREARQKHAARGAAFNPSPAAGVQASGDGDGSLAHRLQQLDVARKAGLLDEAEYQAKRADIVARF